MLTHLPLVPQYASVNRVNIGSDNGLSPGRRQAIIWASVGILLIGPLVINFSEILIKINTFSLKKMHLKMSSAKLQPFCPGVEELNQKHDKSFVVAVVSRSELSAAAVSILI